MHTLSQLPYSYDALEPIIDAQTMQIHHTKHHQTYIDKLNAGLSTYPQYEGWSVKELLEKIQELPDSLQSIVRNHAGGYANHNLFWKIMKPASENNRPGSNSNIAIALDHTFGSFEIFQSQYTEKAVGHFGSGRVWLVQDGENISIITTSNQDSPVMNHQTPLLCLDLREHAYYLHYQNKRAEYVTARWLLVNWDEVEKNFSK